MKLDAQHKKICDATLRLAAKRGWDGVTIERVAKEAKISLAQLKKNCPDRHALLPLLFAAATAHVALTVGKPDPQSSSPRDRLFEALMARFDWLQANRRAILSLSAASPRDPRMIAILVPSQIAACREMLQLIGLQADGIGASAVAAVLWGIFLLVFRVWRSDETLDMTKTMAALDRCLRCAEKSAIFFRIKNRWEAADL